MQTRRVSAVSSAWDLTALLNAADPKASLPERHLWLIRLFEWLRHAPLESAALATPTPVLRLRHLLGVLDRNPAHRARVAEQLGRFWSEVDSTALLADFGFAPRTGLWGELGRRLRRRVLPLTPATTDLGDLFALLLPHADDAAWLNAIAPETLASIRALLAAAPTSGADWREPFFDAIMFLTSAVRAAGFSSALRRRMSAELLVHNPFRQLTQVAAQVREHAAGARTGRSGQPVAGSAVPARPARRLPALRRECRRTSRSVRGVGRRGVRGRPADRAHPPHRRAARLRAQPRAGP